MGNGRETAKAGTSTALCQRQGAATATYTHTHIHTDTQTKNINTHATASHFHTLRLCVCKRVRTDVTHRVQRRVPQVIGEGPGGGGGVRLADAIGSLWRRFRPRVYAPHVASGTGHRSGPSSPPNSRHGGAETGTKDWGTTLPETTLDYGC